jgi:uncharacterized protein YcfJ
MRGKHLLVATSVAALLCATVLGPAASAQQSSTPQPPAATAGTEQPAQPEKKKRFSFRDAIPVLTTVVTGVGGALLCNQIGKQLGMSDAERAQLAISCGAMAGAGGWQLGNNIKRNLQERDQLKLVTATRESLRSGKSQRLELPDSGALAEIKAGPDFKEVKTAQFEFDPNALKTMPSPRLEVIGANYASSADQFIRSGPDKAASVVSGLSANSPTLVLGRVQGTDWLLVGRDGVAMGYVPASQFKPTELAIAAGQKPATVQKASVEMELTCRPMDLGLEFTDASKPKEEQSIRLCTDHTGQETIAT